MEAEATVTEEIQEEAQTEVMGPPSIVSAGTYYGEKDEETGNRPRLEASITIFPGGDLTQAVEMYGEDTVFDDYKKSVERRATNAVRSSLNKYLEGGKDPQEIPGLVQSELSGWRPDSDRRPTRKSPEEDILANFSSLPAEKKAEILARLQAQASGQ